MDDDNHNPEEESGDDAQFPDFDVDTERDGDPFSRIDPSADEDDTPDWMEQESPRDQSDAETVEGVDIESRSSNSAGQGEPTPQQEVTGPSDMSIHGDMFDTGHDGDDPFDEDSLFTEVDTETLDEDALWEEIQADDTDTTVDSAGTAEESIGEVVVSKSRFCQQCKHFAAPPEIGCQHDGTEILEFVGVDEVRLKNCPIVAKERELGHSIE